ncbi:MAG TPA: methyltransferase domain-containing protein [Gemmatimonadaceae bacterium]|nr:methyltransferase domain-containing protein [Gemmatimonadaceae bacterium]
MTRTSSADDFLAPRFAPTNLDRFLVRTTLLREIRAVLPKFAGTLLDVGCGYMPYKPLVLAPPSRVTEYVGLDLPAGPLYNASPDLTWDGKRIPLRNGAVDCAMATEVLEHCPDPDVVLREVRRVVKPGGHFFFTVPFLWPLHDVPHDEYRYTPFALERHLRRAGFARWSLKALGGWDASLAQMIGLWVRRRPMVTWQRRLTSILALPVIRFLIGRDEPPPIDHRTGGMITGIAGLAVTPRAEPAR